MKTFCVLFPAAVLLCLSGCASLPSSSEENTFKVAENAVETGRGTSPVITDAGFSPTLSYKGERISEVTSGETSFLFVRLKDSQWDISNLSVVPVLGNDASDEMKIPFAGQYEEEFYYSVPIVLAKKGRWILRVSAEDFSGNRSAVIKVPVVVR